MAHDGAGFRNGVIRIIYIIKTLPNPFHNKMILQNSEINIIDR